MSEHSTEPTPGYQAPGHQPPGHQSPGHQVDVYTALGEDPPGHGPLVPRPDAVQRYALAWLASYESAHTRRGYSRDLTAWLGFLTEIGIHPWTARRVHVDAWARAGAGYAKKPAASSLARRLASVSAFYAYVVIEEIPGGPEQNPVTHVRRPASSKDDSPTRSLTREEGSAMLTTALEQLSPRDRVWILAGLLLGLRRSAMVDLNIDDLGWNRGHRTLTYTSKGGRRATVPVPPLLTEALEQYLTSRGHPDTGPLLTTTTGRRISAEQLYRIAQRTARLANITAPHTVTPHSLRHAFITLALDAGASLRDVQDAAGHADPRTTRRYDHARGQLDRHPTYTLGTYLT